MSSQVGIAGIIVSLCAGQALAQSNVTYVLEMGGNNNAAAYKSGNRQKFTPGSTANGQIFAPNTLATWAVRLNAGGVQQNGNGAGFAIKGVANFVFDLELRSGSAGGPLVTNPTNIFMSTINDGQGNDIYAAAAFAFSFDALVPGTLARVVDQLSGTPPAGSFGYIGGPNCGSVDNSSDRLKSATYPTPEPGKIVGMGAGYNLWSGSGTQKTTCGLGMNITPGITPDMPVCEGQLNLTGLANGTYFLVVKTGSPANPTAGPLGTNVLRGDLNPPNGLCNTSQSSFATAADTTTGTTISFVIGNPPATKATNPNPANGAVRTTSSPVTLSWTAGNYATSHDVRFGTTNPPPLVSTGQAGTTYPAGSLANGVYYWRIDEKNIDNVVTTGDVWSFTVNVPTALTIAQWRSVRTHTGAGDLAIVLNAAGSSGSAVTSEPRSGGVRVIQVDFTEAVSLLDPEPVITAAGSDSEFYDSTNAFLADSDTLQIEYADGLPDQVCFTINLTGLIASEDFSKNLTGDRDCRFRNLYGDANPMAPSVVNLSDSLCVKARVGTSVSASPWADLNLDGAIGNDDALSSKGQFGGTACP